MTVASKMCRRVLNESVSQSSFSSGVRPIPWLGQPCRLVGPFWKPCTSTRCSFRPDTRSPISKPSSSLTFTKQSVCRPLTVNGRMLALNGPTVRIARCERGVGDRQQRRLQPGEIGFLAVETGDRVVRTRVGRDPGQLLAIVGTHHVPERALERREEDQPAVRRHRHPVATPIVFLFPEQLLGDQVQTHELLGRADVDLLGRGIGAHALDVERLALGVEPGGRDALDELVAVVDVEDQQAVAAVLEIVANPGLRDVE